MANIEKPKANATISIIVKDVDQTGLSNTAFGCVKQYNNYRKLFGSSVRS